MSTQSGYGYGYGITLSTPGILILYWIITILTQSIMTDPNPSSSASSSSISTQPSSPPPKKSQQSTSPKPEPFLVRLAISPALLSLLRLLIALPALHLTLLTITLSPNTPSPSPSPTLLPLLCPLLPTASPLPFLHKTTHHLSYLPTLFPGVFLALLTSPLRLLCFYTLGQNFTFNLTPPKHNKLVKTGFYKFVRHPSYLFALTGVLGFLCFVLGSGQGGVLVGCYALGLSPSPSTTMNPMDAPPEIKYLWTAAAVGFAVVIEMFRERVISEEKFLEECIGKEEWEEYKRQTPWMFVPGVY